jgi:gas vesicle protein
MQRINWHFDVNDVLGAVGLQKKGRAVNFAPFLIGLGIGVVGGCAAAMLLTPYSGSETREKLLRAGEDLGKSVSSKVDELARGFRTEARSIGGGERSRVGV